MWRRRGGGGAMRCGETTKTRFAALSPIGFFVYASGRIPARQFLLHLDPASRPYPGITGCRNNNIVAVGCYCHRGTILPRYKYVKYSLKPARRRYGGRLLPRARRRRPWINDGRTVSAPKVPAVSRINGLRLGAQFKCADPYAYDTTRARPHTLPDRNRSSGPPPRCGSCDGHDVSPDFADLRVLTSIDARLVRRVLDPFGTRRPPLFANSPFLLKSKNQYISNKFNTNVHCN